MDFDDEFEDEVLASGGMDSGRGSVNETVGKDLLRPTLSNPVSAYLFLSDDAQDESSVPERMRCLSCGRIFKGEVTSRCPECKGVNVIRDPQGSVF